MGGTIKLEDIRAGNVLRYQGAEWTVSEKSVCSESASYVETQWTLQSYGTEAYLLKTEAKKDAGTEVVWVFTRATGLGNVLFERIPGVWHAFEELAMPASAPATVKLADQYFSFNGETSGMAVDDEGDTVTKVTWDYYSADRKRNLAIENWKEPDRDYPEAYDGKVVAPSAFEVLEKKVRVVSSGELFVAPGEELRTGLVMAGLCGFVCTIMGLPLDYFISFGPAAVVVLLMYLTRPPAWLWLSSGAVWAAIIALVWYKGFGLSFWYITALCAGLSLLLPRLLAASFPGQDPGRYYRTAIFGVLPALWVYSFLEYLMYAPGPRAFYQVFAAMLLPLAAAGLCALLGYFTERSAPNV